MANVKHQIPKLAHKTVGRSSYKKFRDRYSSRDRRDEIRRTGGNHDPNVDKGRKTHLRRSGEQKLINHRNGE